MSVRTPPGGTKPRAHAKPPEEQDELLSSFQRSGRRKKSFVVIALVAVALAAVYGFVFLNPALASKPSSLTNPYTAKPGETAAAQTAAPTLGSGLQITEVMTCNKGSITAQDGNYYDWIELYNPTAKPIGLAGYALSDNPKKPTKSVLPAWTLDPGKYVIVFADGGKSTPTELHASFKLKASGSVLTLIDPNGRELQKLSVPQMTSGQSWAADMSNPSSWAAAGKVTPGFPNNDQGYQNYQKTLYATTPVYINEIMTGNTMTLRDSDGSYPDWIELYNPTDKPVDLTGWGLSHKDGDPKQWVFPKTVIGPKQYLTVFCSGKNRAAAGGELHTGFKLNSFEGTVLLSNLRGQIVNEVKLDGLNLKADQSYGLQPGSTDSWREYSQPTPGQPNDTDGWNAFQAKLYDNTDSPVIIHSVMSDNTKTLKNKDSKYPDWIELYNRSNKSVSLKGYGLTGSADKPGEWRFPDVAINPGQYLTVFALGTDAGGNAAGGELDANFKLSASGSMVVLTAPDGKMADRCFVPPLKPDMAYGRVQGSMAFSYVMGIKPGAAITSGYPGITPDPAFSLKAGTYDGAQQVTLDAGDAKEKVYYTTDGSAPTQSSTLYAGPISLPKTMVVRAVAYRDGYLPGDVVTETYTIGEKHTLPVISISTTPKNLFDTVTGIYMPGPNASKDASKFMEGANFYKNTEVPASFEVYDESGKRVFNQDIGLSMAGGLGLIKNQKTLAIHARSEYGQGTMNYKFFDNRPYTEYKSLVLRTNRDASKIRESVIFGLVDGKMDIVTQAYKPYVVYINGQYWGVYNLMEKRNKYMVSQHEGGSDPDKINIVKGSGGIVSHGSNTDYKSLVTYAKSHDMSQKATFDYVSARLDTDSFMDVMINLIYIGNTDYYNMQYYQVPGGKWTQILYDTELTLQNPNHETLKARMGNTCNSDLFNGLLKYKPWKDKFIDRFAWAMKEIYNPGRVNSAIDKAAADIQAEVAPMRTKFGDTATVDDWNTQIAQLHTYANKRPAIMVSQLEKTFSLTADQKAMLEDAVK